MLDIRLLLWSSEGFRLPGCSSGSSTDVEFVPIVKSLPSMRLFVFSLLL